MPIRVIAGTVENVTGPVREVAIQPQYLDVSVPPHTVFTHPIPRGHTAFAYVFSGKGVFCRQNDPFTYDSESSSYFDQQRDRLVGDRHLVQFGDGDAMTVVTEGDAVRFLLVSGQPLGEPIAWRGPIVMNTQAELRLAFEELDTNTFIKHKAR